MRKIISSSQYVNSDNEPSNVSVVKDTSNVLELFIDSKVTVFAFEDRKNWQNVGKDWREFCDKVAGLVRKINDVRGIQRLIILSNEHLGQWTSYYIKYKIVFEDGEVSDSMVFRLSHHNPDLDNNARRGYTGSNFSFKTYDPDQKRYNDTAYPLDLLKSWLKERVKAYKESDYQNPYASRQLTGRRIYSAAQQNQIPATLQVNRVGKYIYNHTDGAYKFVKSSNTYDVYITLLYQLLPQYVERDSNGKRVTRQGEQMEWDYCPFCGDKLTNPNFGGCKECQDPMELNDVDEMTINVSITTYQNKIRVNTIEVDPMERTLGYDLFKPEEMVDLVSASKKIMEKVHKRIKKAYEKYDILF